MICLGIVIFDSKTLVPVTSVTNENEASHRSQSQAGDSLDKVVVTSLLRALTS